MALRVRRVMFRLGLYAFFTLLLVSMLWVPATASDAAPSPADLMIEGQRAFEHGAFASAIHRWQHAARLFAQAGEPGAQSAALTHLAQAYQALGHTRKSLSRLDQALALARQSNQAAQIAETSGDARMSSYAWGYLGQLYEADRRYDEACS